MPIPWLESGVIPRHQLYSMRYLDFVADPLASVLAMYEHFGIEATDEGRAGMQAYLDANPGSERPRHIYAARSEGLERGVAAASRDTYFVLRKCFSLSE